MVPTEERALHLSLVMATSSARAPIPVPRAGAPRPSIPRPERLAVERTRSSATEPTDPTEGRSESTSSVPPRPSGAVPRPQASSAPPPPASIAAVPKALPKPVFAKPTPAQPVKTASVTLVPKPDPSGPRVRELDSESRVVAVRSMQPTLPGIGPDDDVEVTKEPALPSSPYPSSPHPSNETHETHETKETAARSPEPTICELDERFLVDERSGTLVDVHEAPQQVVREAPMLHIVPNLSPAIQPSPQGDPMPRTSHVPPPQARIAAPVPAVMPVTQFAPTQFAPQFAPAPATPTPSPRVSLSDPSRASLSDPMDVLFDAAYDLCFLQTAVEGANHCMASALRAVGGRAALVHLLDVHTGEFVTVAGIGDGADRQILSRHEDDDWLLSAAVFKGKPLTMEYGGEVSGRPLPRHAALGSPTNVVVVPVIGWGRALAVLEVVDASEAMLAGGRGENALAYLAQRFAEFLGEREIVLAPHLGQFTGT